MKHIRPLRELHYADLAIVGEKNAMLGELVRVPHDTAVTVPDGFAITADAYRERLREASLEDAIHAFLDDVHAGDAHDVIHRSDHIRDLVLRAPLPPSLFAEIEHAYHALSRAHGELASDVAVRASATCTDPPDEAYANRYESFLNVRGMAALEESIRHVFASLFTPRAIATRIAHGIAHREVAMAVGVQKMVRSDLASAGVVYTADPETLDRSRIVVTSSWGLGDGVAQERVVPDRIILDRAALETGRSPILSRSIGSKETKVVYDWHGHRQVLTVPVPRPDREHLSCSYVDAIELARFALAVERHFSTVLGREIGMEIEWAKDGITGACSVVQARTETSRARRVTRKLRVDEVIDRAS